jgi:hypothetical protein
MFTRARHWTAANTVEHNPPYILETARSTEYYLPGQTFRNMLRLVSFIVTAVGSPHSPKHGGHPHVGFQRAY